MAITDKKTGVWGLDQTYNKINQGSIWEYTGPNVLFARGRNDTGAIGQNTATPTQRFSSPVQITTATSWSKVAWSDGGNAACGAINTDGELYVWGRNDYAQLALNDKADRSSPTQLPGTTWSQVAFTNNKGGGVKTDGTLWTWGGNEYGSLGFGAAGAPARRSSPTQVPGTNWKYVSFSYSHGIFTRTDGTLWGCGYNVFGSLGQNNRDLYSSPRQIPGTTWAWGRAGGWYRTYGAKTDGTLWAWGANGGQLGLNDTPNPSSPTQIGTATTWPTDPTKFSATLTSNMAGAIKTDGTLWILAGNENNGMIANNKSDASGVQFSAPIQIPGTNWDSINIGGTAATATKTDGTAWVWGKNTPYGELGLNDTVSRSSPTQLPGNSWGPHGSAGLNMYWGIQNQ